MNILNYKLNTIVIPSYNDGYFNLYRIEQKGIYPVDILKLIDTGFAFAELSVGDKLKYELKERNIDVAFKVLIPQEKIIDSLCVLLIETRLYKVANAYHFVDKDGFPKTRLTLENYVLKGV